MSPNQSNTVRQYYLHLAALNPIPKGICISCLSSPVCNIIEIISKSCMGTAQLFRFYIVRSVIPKPYSVTIKYVWLQSGQQNMLRGRTFCLLLSVLVCITGGEWLLLGSHTSCHLPTVCCCTVVTLLLQLLRHFSAFMAVEEKVLLVLQQPDLYCHSNVICSRKYIWMCICRICVCVQSQI